MTAQMVTVSEHSASVLEELTTGLNVGDSRKIDRGLGFMAVHVECIHKTELGPLFSIAHYFEVNGDLVADPDVVFLRRADGSWVPTSFRSSIAYRVAVHFHDDGTIEIEERELQSLVQFADMWMRNVGDQQGLPTRKSP